MSFDSSPSETLNYSYNCSGRMNQVPFQFPPMEPNPDLLNVLTFIRKIIKDGQTERYRRDKEKRQLI